MTSAVTSLKDRLPTTIRTERLVLTTPVKAHAQAIAQLANNENVHRWMARLPFPYGLEDAHFFIDAIVASDSEYCLAITHDDTFMGVIGLTFPADGAPELGYWLGEPHWGHGYATEAARAVIDAARSAGAAALASRARASNAGSRNVLKKAGFTETTTIIETEGNLAGREMVLMHMEFGER